jgi:SP family sugar:H+ symporter-like MFS transporter
MVFTAGVAMQTAAKSIPLFTVGRFFGGLGVGGNSCVIPIYLAEWFVPSSIQIHLNL